MDVAAKKSFTIDAILGRKEGGGENLTPFAETGRMSAVPCTARHDRRLCDFAVGPSFGYGQVNVTDFLTSRCKL